LIAIGILVLFVVVGAVGSRHNRFNTADRGFRNVTGADLPANVTAMAHASRVDDNFFHEAHYWLVQGPIESLRELAPAPGYERSDADAAEILRYARRAIPSGEDAPLLEGYEGSVDSGRDHWLLILPPGDRAIFVY
jgi:hypothetical protein